MIASTKTKAYSCIVFTWRQHLWCHRYARLMNEAQKAYFLLLHFGFFRILSQMWPNAAMFNSSEAHHFVFFNCKTNFLFGDISLKKGTKQNKTIKQQHQASPSSSVDPGIFVFCQLVSLLKQCHDCFPCNKKSSFLQSRTQSTIYTNITFN